MKPAPLIHTIDPHSEMHIFSSPFQTQTEMLGERLLKLHFCRFFFLRIHVFVPEILRNSALIVEISVAETAEVTFDQISSCVNEQKQEEVPINNHLPTYHVYKTKEVMNS